MSFSSAWRISLIFSYTGLLATSSQSLYFIFSFKVMAQFCLQFKGSYSQYRILRKVFLSAFWISHFTDFWPPLFRECSHICGAFTFPLLLLDFLFVHQWFDYVWISISFTFVLRDLLSFWWVSTWMFLQIWYVFYPYFSIYFFKLILFWDTSLHAFLDMVMII